MARENKIRLGTMAAYTFIIVFGVQMQDNFLMITFSFFFGSTVSDFLRKQAAPAQ